MRTGRQGALLLQCTRLTSSCSAQLIFNTSPLMTALLASALMGAEPPLRLLPTLLLTIAGTGTRLSSLTYTRSEHISCSVRADVAAKLQLSCILSDQGCK